VDVTLDDFDRLSRDTPHLCSMRPGGDLMMEDLDAVGGVSAVMKNLRPLLHTGCVNVAGCALGDEIFLAVPHKYLAVFNTQTSTWRTVPVPRPPRSCQMAGYRGEVWLLGGRGVHNGREVQIFNPATGRWRSGPDLPRELVWGCAAVVDGRLIVAGGAAGSCYSNRTWMLRESDADE